MKTDTLYKLIIATLVTYLIVSIIFSYGFHRKISSLELKNDSLNVELINLRESNKILEDELQFREDEITYWGMKYDSVKTYLEHN